MAELRRQNAERKGAELRRVRDMVAADEQIKETAGAAIPEPVARRMGQRMLPFVGLPLFGGMAAFVAFWYLATYKNMDFEPSMVAASTIGILVVGLLVRVVYSAMSITYIYIYMYTYSSMMDIAFSTMNIFPFFRSC